MKTIDKAIKLCDASGIHFITYKDIDGETVKEKIIGIPSDVQKREDELKKHGCKIVKIEMFQNWRN